MTCPACGIENPPSAQYCDCGHEFVFGSRPKESVPAQPQGTSTQEMIGKVIGGGFLLAIIVLIGIFVSDSREKYETPRAYTPLPERPESKVSIKKFGWKKGGFDTVLLATFTLRNDKAYDVKGIRIKCEPASRPTQAATTMV